MLSMQLTNLTKQVKKVKVVGKKNNGSFCMQSKT